MMNSKGHSHLLVLTQLFGVGLSCYPVGWLNRGSAWWLAVCLLGSIFGVWALFHNRIGNFSVYPELKSHAVLVTSGPYALVRHPMYSALMLMMLGVAGYNGHPLNLLGFLMVAAAVVAKSLKEERLLGSRFPGYADYARSTRRFIPTIY